LLLYKLWAAALKVAAYIRAEHADIHAEYAAGKVTSLRQQVGLSWVHHQIGFI